jgi:hypothetical protein
VVLLLAGLERAVYSGRIRGSIVVLLLAGLERAVHSAVEERAVHSGVEERLSLRLSRV